MQSSQYAGNLSLTEVEDDGALHEVGSASCTVTFSSALMTIIPTDESKIPRTILVRRVRTLGSSSSSNPLSRPVTPVSRAPKTYFEILYSRVNFSSVADHEADYMVS